MKKILAILFVGILASLNLLSCLASDTKMGFLPNQTAVAYSFIHGNYVGQAFVTTDNEGKLEVEIDEAFLPDVLCAVSYGINGWNDETTISYESRGKKYYVAKYIEYADTIYVAVQSGKTFSYVKADDKGEAVGETQLDKEIITNQDTMASYFDNIKNGKLRIFAQFGGYAIPITLSMYGGLTKRKAPDYWNNGLGWAGNIKAIEDFIEDYGSQYSLNEMSQASEKNKEGLRFWSVADTVTGATNSDFKSYFALAQSAIARLKTHFPR
ncbi:MAG: hypothetical protein JXR70_03005 [Spirochaetales bacterium]|nr:hypothetical protein [Spirochaetales bacterium]